MYDFEELRKEILAKLRMPKLRIEKALIETEAWKEFEGDPPIIRAAKTFYKLAKEIPITIEDWQLIVGSPSSEPFTVSPHPIASWRWVNTELDTFSTREGDKYLVTEEDKKILREILPQWRGKSIEDRVRSALPEETLTAYEAGLIDSGYISNGSGNYPPNYEKILKKGMYGIIDEIKEKMNVLDLTKPEDYKKYLFYKAALICCEAAILYAKRFADLARKLAEKETREWRKKELLIIAQNCERVPAYPARTFPEALQAIWFIHALAHFEVHGAAGIVLGRLDQYLYPYFKEYVKEYGVEEAKKWLKNFWININQILLFLPKRTSLIWSGHPISEQPTIGGVNVKGEDATNELTELILEVEKEVRLQQPDIAIMYHKNIKEELLEKSCEVLPLTMKPKFFNYEIALHQVLTKGATPDEAKEGLVIIGCVSSGIAGKTWGNNNMAFVNLPKALELALNNGIDPLTGKRVGPATGDPSNLKTFEDLFNAFKEQLRHAIRMAVILSIVIENVHREVNPQPFASILVDDCIERGLPVWEGGARYNIPGIEGVGLATVTDSLAAIKKLVFEEGRISLTELIKALRSNWEGYEYLRQVMINEAPKFGNDDDYVDSIAREVAEYFCKEVLKYRSPRGVPYYPALYSVSAHVGLGRFVGATPDGRYAREPLSDGMSPAQGRCNTGPTAVIKSITKIDHKLAANGTLLNMKFNASLLRSPEKRKKFIAMLKTYMDLGGYHVQFNFIDTELLREAQRHPEKYPDLLVRVAAYVAQFTALPKELQDDIIARSELDIA
jgi:formate C-acetyltransferase